jgi:V/A-type H+-transporting ATPase subunit E
MEMELKSIIEKIKTEGVSEAENQASKIIADAETKAKAMMESARKENEIMAKKAEQEAEKLRHNSEEAIKQASRDVLISLRQSIVNLFDLVMKGSVAEGLTPEVLKDMIVRMAESVAKEKKFEVEVLLSEKDKKTLEKLALSDFKKKMGKGITLKVSTNVEHGFLIGEKGGSSYYDFTDEAIAEAFKTYLNPKITQILSGE